MPLETTDIPPQPFDRLGQDVTTMPQRRSTHTTTLPVAGRDAHHPAQICYPPAFRPPKELTSTGKPQSGSGEMEWIQYWRSGMDLLRLSFLRAIR